MALAAGAVALCGCNAGHPSDDQVRQVNGLMRDRTDAKWDVAQLLKDGSAPAEPTGLLTLGQATDLALAHNLSLIASAENLSIAHAQLVQAGLLQNPSLGQSSGWLFPLSPSKGYPSIDVNITMVLNSIFTQPARVSVARLQEFQANIDMATQAYALAQQVDAKYQEMVRLVRARRLLVKVADLYGRAVEAAEARRKVGIITVPELNRARLSYEDARRQVRHVTTQYERAAREMNWLMGFSGPPAWSLPDAATADISADISAATTLPAAMQLEDLGLKFRMDLTRADFDRKISERELSLAKLGMIPEVSVGAELARDGNHNLTGGPFIPSITLPIFDPGLVAVELAKAQQRRAEKTYQALAGQVRQDVRTALDNWRIAADDVAFFRDRQIPQQEENVRLMELSFKYGNDDLDALLNVYQSYVSQLQSYEDAVQAYRDAGVALEQAVGLAWERMVAEGRAAATRPTTMPSTQPSTQPTAQPAMLPSTRQSAVGRGPLENRT